MVAESGGFLTSCSVNVFFVSSEHEPIDEVTGLSSHSGGKKTIFHEHLLPTVALQLVHRSTVWYSVCRPVVEASPSLCCCWQWSISAWLLSALFCSCRNCWKDPSGATERKDCFWVLAAFYLSLFKTPQMQTSLFFRSLLFNTWLWC